MATFGQLQSAIADDLHLGTSYLPRIREAIVSAIAYYKARRFTWNEKRAEIPVAPSDEYLSLSADWVEMDSVVLLDGADRYPLMQVPNTSIDALHRDASYTGLPVWYATTGTRSLRLHPPADATYTLQCVYHYDLQDVTASASDGATNGWTEDGYQMIKLHAMADLAMSHLHGEEMAANAQRWASAAGAIERELRRRYSNAGSSGHITPHL